MFMRLYHVAEKKPEEKQNTESVVEVAIFATLHPIIDVREDDDFEVDLKNIDDLLKENMDIMISIVRGFYLSIIFLFSYDYYL